MNINATSTLGSDSDLQNEGDLNACETHCIHPEAVQQAQAALPSDSVVNASAALFKLLGDTSRLRLLLALRNGELCVCDLAAVTGASESSVSHSLRLLRAARAVQAKKVGRRVYYRLDDDHVAGLLELTTAHMAHTFPDQSSQAPVSAQRL